MCGACWTAVLATCEAGIVGEPEVREASSPLHFVHGRVELDLPGELVDLAPVPGADRSLWVGLIRDGQLVRIDLDTARTEPLG